jgi:hypothetical protein
MLRAGVVGSVAAAARAIVVRRIRVQACAGVVRIAVRRSVGLDLLGSFLLRGSLCGRLAALLSSDASGLSAVGGACLCHPMLALAFRVSVVVGSVRRE